MILALGRVHVGKDLHFVMTKPMTVAVKPDKVREDAINPGMKYKNTGRSKMLCPKMLGTIFFP